jgi:putative transposase
VIGAVKELAQTVGVTTACEALDLPRSGFYRDQAPATPTVPTIAPVRAAPPRALSLVEQAQVRAVLNSERFQDCAPREVYATLLDELTYLCSWRTMYRLLATEDAVRERRNQRRHPAYAKPELLATRPNQTWSWDITKLRGPKTWTYFYLYVILDVYSRCVVGWLLAQRESEDLAQELIRDTCAKHQIRPGQLTLHADNGSAMIAKSVAQLLIDLDVVKSHSRPHVSDDNPYSEAQFKTLKYRPDYPDRFGSLTEARAWAQAFFTWYNHEHHHTGLGLLTPAVVHAGQAEVYRHQRQATLLAAYEKHPERFVKGAPVVPPLPEAVWINPPKPADSLQDASRH